MDLDFFIQIVEDNGYIGLFLLSWLGIFIIPVPNEVLVVTIGGLAASLETLNPFVSFLVAYGGNVVALTTSYMLGRILGRRFLRFLKKRQRFANAMDSSLKLMEKYHAFSLSLSYFIPGVRNIVPLLYGLSKLSFKTFAIFAYTGAFVWVAALYVLGYIFGDRIDTIMKYENELWIGILVVAVTVVLLLLLRKSKEKNQEVDPSPLLQQRQQE